jgi:type I restriction enzyme M protein
MVDNRSTAELIRELRDLAGLTQEAFARELGVSFASVNRWENGRIVPDRVTLDDIERFASGLPQGGDLAASFRARKAEAADAPRRRGRKRGPKSETLPAPQGGGLDLKAMEGMLWKAACSIRGEKDAPKFKDYLLPLLFLKRLSDVFEDEFARLIEEYGSEEAAREVIAEVGHDVVRFQLPEFATWAVISGRKPHDWGDTKKPKTLGEHITLALRALAKENDELRGVVDIVDFNETRNGEREVSDAALRRIIELFSEPRYRLGLTDAEPDFLGRAYEYLLRKFAEGQGQSAGEFFTPTEVGWLIAHLVEPKEGESVYDFACGSAGLLVKCELLLMARAKARGKSVQKPLQLHGQELTGASFAIGRMNMVIHDMAGQIVRGDTIANPKFLTDEGRLRQFDIVVANPMWNQKTFETRQFENDPYERFTHGYPPDSSADWAWLQHALASLLPHGRGAIVLDTGALSRGSGNQGDNKEKTIRQQFVEDDVIEGVVQLPENLFYNTPAAGVIVLLNKNKDAIRRRRVLMVNASSLFVKGRPKNVLTDTSIARIVSVIRDCRTEQYLSAVVEFDELSANDFNLTPGRYITAPSAAEQRGIQAIIDDLAETERRRAAAIQDASDLVTALGFTWRYSIRNSERTS